MPAKTRLVWNGVKYHPQQQQQQQLYLYSISHSADLPAEMGKNPNSRRSDLVPIFHFLAPYTVKKPPSLLIAIGKWSHKFVPWQLFINIYIINTPIIFLSCLSLHFYSYNTTVLLGNVSNVQQVIWHVCTRGFPLLNHKPCCCHSPIPSCSSLFSTLYLDCKSPH